jgi:nicotinamidase-related amidase
MTRNNPNHGVRPKEAALLVIDVQRALFYRPTPIHNAERLINNINSLIEKWEKSNGLVVYIQHSNNKMLIKDTPDWDLHPDLRIIYSGNVVHKLHGNAFENTNLQEILDSEDIKEVVITGLVTQGCVRATCLGARHLGYHVILVKDGHSNYSKDAKEIINEWNRKLSKDTVELIATEKII